MAYLSLSYDVTVADYPPSVPSDGGAAGDWRWSKYAGTREDVAVQDLVRNT